MKVNGKDYRTIWLDSYGSLKIIDQRKLPYEFSIEHLSSVEDVAKAIKDMHVRGAGLIGVAAGYGMYLAAKNGVVPYGFIGNQKKEDFYAEIEKASEKFISTRPTAVNLRYAVKRQLNEINKTGSIEEMVAVSLETATKIADEDAESCRRIGEHGIKIIWEISKKKNGEPVNIMTHCNAGWLAFVDYGSALSPVYAAQEKGIPVHVFVSETRPRNQGANLTAWELEQQKVPYRVIVDNAAGHLMCKGLVDMVIVRADRVAPNGDIANKIGTYMKAVVAKENGIPFYVAFPSSTFDWEIKDGEEIPIEERGEDEVKYVSGISSAGKTEKLLITPKNSRALNYGFDVTPASLITGLITERGICEANEKSIRNLFT